MSRLILIFLFLPAILLAQEEATNEFPPRSMTISKQTADVKVDGILDELLWQQLPKHSDFYQQFPLDGILAEEKTDIQISYDDDNIYIGATIYDDANYVINTLKRDQLSDEDAFVVMLDPQNQNANGYAFGVNPKGAITEALLSAPDDVDSGWDNKWRVATANYEDNWTVEMAIPFKTLRFKKDNLVWGINFFRLDAGDNQGHVWSPVPRQFDALNLGYGGDLVWDQAPSPQGKNIAIIPYITTSSNRDASNDPKTNNSIDAGLDAKVGITSGLNLDLTINPDFSQVDVDRQVTNLTRFNIFFPERRQFFLENADIFNGYGQFANRPFYSRRIGLDPSGNTVPIIFGARLTGNVNQKLRMGAFSMQTNKNEITTAQNYSGFSGEYAIGKRSNVKSFFLSRQAFDGSEAIASDYGRNLGGEVNLSTDDGKWSSQVGYVHSYKDGFSDKNRHLYGRVEYAGQRFRTFLFVQNLGENYYADMGFNARLNNFNPITGTVERIGYTQIGNMLNYYIYPESEKVNFHWSGLENFVIINEGTGLNDWYTRLRHFIFYKNTSQLRFRLNNQFVDLIFPFGITETPLPVGKYNMTEFNIQYVSDIRKLWNFEIFSVYGQFYNGTKLTNVIDLNYRIQPRARFAIGIEQNMIRLPDPYGNLDLFLANASAEINFSTSLFWTTFVQYNTQSKDFNVNSRLQWRYAPMSDLFLVYTDNYLVDGKFGAKNRSIVLKVNYRIGL